MIKNKRLVIQARADEQEFRRLLRKLKSSGWSGPILQSEAEFAKACGIVDSSSIRLHPPPSDRPRRGDRQMGEIFLADGAILYILLRVPDTFRDSSGRVVPIESFDPTIEIGAIYRQENGTAAQNLQDLGELVQKYIPECVDGRKVRHANLAWKAIASEGRRLKSLLANDDLEPHFQQPSLIPDEVNAAEAMISPLGREVMQEISRFSFRTKKDLSSKHQKKVSDVESVLQKLVGASLLLTEYLLECKRNGVAVTRVQDKADLSGSVGALICPWCNSRFSDETISDGYVLSDLGKKLARKSHWLDIFITEKLVALGVPIESILWNFAEATEEIDIVIDVMGELWIFELKDREFGAGDAHPFNYRRVRYEADKAIIVTTSKVSTDAKKILSELLEQGDSSADSVLYVEGIDKVTEILSKELSGVTLHAASRRLKGLAQYCGFNLSSVVTETLRKAQAKTLLKS